MKTLRILAPLDQTPTSLSALETVRGLATTVDVCYVELLHAIVDAGDFSPDERAARQTLAEQFLAHAAENIAARHVEASCRVGWGDPADVILQRVREAHFDFICMTTRAAPNNTGEPGSVAAQLFHKSPLPIIALPAVSVVDGAAAKHAERAFYRAAVYVPAELEAEGIRHPIDVVIRDLSAKGAELETDFDQPLPAKGSLLILPLPTRPEPLEIAAAVVATERRIGEDGQSLQVVHVTFPAIRMADQDAIVAFLNKLRTFEQQQRRVSAPVNLEVITGSRAYAHFRGHTTVVRPDYVWLHMEHFDHIESADVTLRAYSEDGKAALELDGTVTRVKAAGQEFDVEIEVADTEIGASRKESRGDRLMAFLRQYYRQEPEGPLPETGAQPAVLIPRPMRIRREQPVLSRVLTASPHEAQVPTRAPRSGPEVPLQRRVRDAEARALDSILRPPRKAPPIRSI